ncbi:hypothetical protein K3495_g8326 [Podosphaera aphanis]|nr:hypothetical protein K3495_g8326 [Podosphaera aphanis]
MTLLSNILGATYFMTPKPQESESEATLKPRPLTHIQKLNQIYKLPAPLRTFPLPSLVPHNPISLLHVVYTWVYQTINYTPSLITPIYQGWFSLETRSVHVTDCRSIRGLWEQGFFGKGSLSRSEPNWLDGEISRIHNKNATTSEEFTRKRRAERQKTKWERARKERLAIEQKLLEEAEAIRFEKIDPSFISLISNDVSSFSYRAPTGPLELLSLPNSQSDLKRLEFTVQHLTKHHTYSSNESTITTDDQIGRKSISEIDATLPASVERNAPGSIQRNIDHGFDILSSSETCDLSNKVREKLDEPSFPLYSDENKSTSTMESRNTQMTIPASQQDNLNRPELKTSDNEEKYTKENVCLAIRNEEHFQLTLEEAFFLCYSFRCLQVKDPISKSEISTESLFQLCRQNSYFPPCRNSDLSTDDPFMINYIVYHHFRSLGWVVRSGIKFSVDYMLYNRGPVFSHAEFAVLILPSYSDSYWSSTASLRDYSSRKQHRSWAWMSCVNRVISQVKKTLILCYVDIPQPLSLNEEKSLGINATIARYKVREFVMSRFLTNRMRA